MKIDPELTYISASPFSPISMIFVMRVAFREGTKLVFQIFGQIFHFLGIIVQLLCNFGQNCTIIPPKNGKSGQKSKI